MTNRIAVHKEDHEGAIQLEAVTSMTKTGEPLTRWIVATAADERPEWAEGLAEALMDERATYYRTRLGSVPENVAAPELLSANDLEWVGVDAEGDEVHVEADHEYRMGILATALGIDREDYDQERNFQNSIAQAEATHTYKTQPTDEATLEQAEGQSFTDAQKTVAQG
ncbi:hypothetical protein [Mesorhizobium sp. M0767]|uniref:hypothetical protein n=1 Tax=Mesorhizobium sp. M0767 TaxID=2956995 RepID=UPI00333AE903